jgi:hypothetical protein
MENCHYKIEFFWKNIDDHVNTNQEVKSLLARSGLCLWNFSCPTNELLVPGFGQVAYVEDYTRRLLRPNRPPTRALFHFRYAIDIVYILIVYLLIMFIWVVFICT